MPPVIQVNNLKKSYKLAKAKNGQKTFEAVKGVTFNVEAGEVFGILGPNGAGKTTTLEIIEGLKAQSEGTVKVLNFDNLTQTEDIKKNIGIQLQSSQYLHHLSLGELLNLFASFYPKTSVGPDNILPLQLVDLEDKINEEFANLSGGQKQRFTIATSLVHNPKILFLDEPTTGLDPKARHDMWQLIKNINQKGITIVLTTHYMEEAEFLCSRVAIMDEGKILEIGEPKKLIDRLSDTIQVSFFTDQKIDEKIFSVLPKIKKVLASYPKTLIEIASLDDISSVVNLLKSKNVNFYGFTVKTATLEDVYLKLTGKTYEDE